MTDRQEGIPFASPWLFSVSSAALRGALPHAAHVRAAGPHADGRLRRLGRRQRPGAGHDGRPGAGKGRAKAVHLVAGGWCSGKDCSVESSQSDEFNEQEALPGLHAVLRGLLLVHLPATQLAISSPS